MAVLGLDCINAAAIPATQADALGNLKRDDGFCRMADLLYVGPIAFGCKDAESSTDVLDNAGPTLTKRHDPASTAIPPKLTEFWNQLDAIFVEFAEQVNETTTAHTQADGKHLQTRNFWGSISKGFKYALGQAAGRLAGIDPGTMDEIARIHLTDPSNPSS